MPHTPATQSPPNSDAGKNRSRAESPDPFGARNDSELTGRKQPRHGSSSERPSVLTDSISSPDISDPRHQCARDEAVDQPCDAPSFPVNGALGTDREEMLITSIRATSVALCLGRLPAGFYTVVRHSGHEWRTENERSSVDADLVEWAGSIPIPSNPSATVSLEVYASFEFQPMLGTGEQLRKLTVTVEQLLDCSAANAPFTFEGAIGSSCSSISVTIERYMDSPEKCVFLPHRSSPEPQKELEDATNEAHSALSRYRRLKGKQDLELAIAKFERAYDVCPVDHPCRAAAQCNLATAKLILCQAEGMTTPFAPILALYRDALRSRPTGHMDRPATLIQLASVSLLQSDQSSDEGDAAKVALHEALRLSPADSHENLAARIMLQQCVGCQADPVDVPLLVEGNSMSGSTDQGSCASGVAPLERYQRSGKLDDLEQGIARARYLLRISSVWDEHFYGWLSDLGGALLVRFQRLGELGDLGDAISTLRDAAQLTPDGPDKLICLNNLGFSLSTRFSRLGELGDLDDAIATQRDVVSLTPDGHPGRPGRLSNLGLSLRIRFERLGELDDLDEAISIQRDAVQLIPDDHSNMPGCLSNLGIILLSRFERLGELDDLDEAILAQRGALLTTPDGHGDRPGWLDSLGISLFNRFKRLGELGDIDEAIATQRDAVRLTPDGHPNMPGYLNNLGISLRTRFSRLGELRNLDEAIATQRDVVQLTPDGHPDKASCLNNLANSLLARFERLAELGDLDNAIANRRDAIQLIPDSHPVKSTFLNNFGHSLFTRFERLGELDDLEDAVSAQRDAVQLTPHGHPSKLGYLSNLGNFLCARFERLGELGDLDDAIYIQRDVVQLTPADYPEKSGRLGNLGISLHNRFQCLGELGDLDEAISTQRDATQLAPDGHPDKPGHLNNLGRSLATRFEYLRELDDLDNAITTQRDAVQLTPFDHPEKSRRLRNLGDSLLTRFSCLGEFHNLEGALSVYAFAASFPLGSVHIRFRASQNWILCARHIHHRSLLHAYSVAINLLPQLAWIGLSLGHRYSELTQRADFVREAVAAALDAKLPELAVEWLEQGRSIVWGEQFRLRGSYEDLASAHPDHAGRLQELSIALDHASADREMALSMQSPESEGLTPESLRRKADRHRALAIERDNILKEIRRLHGFERFLTSGQFSQLRASAHTDPIVLLNAAQSRCDALIVLANVDHVVHLPLPKFTLQQSANLQNTMKNLIRREGRPIEWERPDWGNVLHPLWKSVVKPVLDALACSTPGNLSRIFWCPTGSFAFLPFHAAGLYDEENCERGHKVFDFVVSSYTPSLALLVPSPIPTADRSDSLRFLAVRQPATDGQGKLAGVAVELEYISEALESPPSAHTTFVEPSTGTVEEVLSLMKDANWVHFACHGVQDGIDSGLCLANGRRLKVRDIIALSRPRGGLAFLSACQTAMGEKSLSNEAIHIAAGMLFAGYGGVIGTMWSISDNLAPLVARDVYRHLFRNGRQPDYREAAYALHKAIGDLRTSVGASFDDWVPFIHVGV